MAVESYTEELVLKELKCILGMNSFGYVYPQGDVSNIVLIDNLLKQAGGKPVDCDIDDYSKGGNGKGKPEFIITFNNYPNLIVVVECKNAVSKHSSQQMNKPKGFAIDGVLYYAKYLKQEFDVIALAVSGTQIDKLKVSSYEWRKGHDKPLEYSKGKDVVLEVDNYLRLYNGEQIQRRFSLDEIRKTAVLMHNTLREIKMTERNKPIFIAGILIALNDSAFESNFTNLNDFDFIMDALISSIRKVLHNTDIQKDKTENIVQAFIILKTNTKLKSKNLNELGSIRWYISELDNKIKPMMFHADNTLDALGVFYHEFIKYSGGDGQGLGIILTPQHLTEFMVDLVNVSKTDRVVDICCGSGSFLITAMTKMFNQATNTDETDKIRKEGLYGVDFDPELYTLAIANMIIRKDGKSNIKYGDCFNKDIASFIRNKKCTIGLMNPPYSQKDKVELEFVEQLLSLLEVGGKASVVVPMSCAIGTKYKEVRERLFKHHSLKAVFSMPDEIFYPTGTNVCVMVWEAHKSHDSSKETYFGYCKDDGFVKRKKLGRVDVNNRWESIKKEWLRLYQNLEVKPGVSAKKCVTHLDEWLTEAYMKTDYSKITMEDFQSSVNDYLAYLVKSGEIHEGR